MNAISSFLPCALPRATTRSRILAAVLLLLALPLVAEDDYADKRAKMVGEIAAMAKLLGTGKDAEAIDPGVMAAMAKVPRHEFVPEGQRRNAYENRPLPIGYSQTISQPYIVAVMTELARPKPDDAVLEIGTGSGYQAAILAELTKAVYTIEIVEPLAKRAKETLARLGYGTVKTRTGDGYYGWEEGGPYDAIVVTAAADHIPPPLIRQLKPGGRMVIPIGASFATQELMLVEKQPDGSISTRQLMAVRFVPLTGGH